MKFAIRGATLTATFTNSDGVTTVNYQLYDVFDLNYQQGRGAVYNGGVGIGKPIWIYALDGRNDMITEANWSEQITR